MMSHICLNMLRFLFWASTLRAVIAQNLSNAGQAGFGRW